MEKDTLLAHGATRFLREKFHKDSDGYDSYVCKTCGTTDIIYNPTKEIYRCDVCK
jgi:DNA-directed RNA polymerase beta subunit